MNCPLHSEVWLFEDGLKAQGYCKRCNKWYNLEEVEKDKEEN